MWDKAKAAADNFNLTRWANYGSWAKSKPLLGPQAKNGSFIFELLGEGRNQKNIS